MAAFSFRPQPALDLRRREEDAAQRAVAEARMTSATAPRRRSPTRRPRSTRARRAPRAPTRAGGSVTDVIWHRNWIRSLRRELARSEADAEDRPRPARGRRTGARRRARARQGARAIEGAGRRGAPSTGAARASSKAIDELATPALRDPRRGESHRERIRHLSPTRDRRHDATSGTTPDARAALGQDAFLKLLITQLAEPGSAAAAGRTASSSRSWRSSARSRSSRRSRRRSRSSPTAFETLAGIPETPTDRQTSTGQQHQHTGAAAAAPSGEHIMAVGSFSAGLSGLNANSTYLSVIGNNLANINTIGFKTSTVQLRGPRQPDGRRHQRQPDAGRPRRRRPARSRRSSARASIENTREATNVAIQGNGFFVGA